MSQLFVECIIAPSYDATALAIFTKKKNLRVMELGEETCKEQGTQAGLDFKKISGGFLVQEKDVYKPLENLETVTERAPTDAEQKDLLFTWTVSKHVKSNAIVFGRDEQTLGVGAGQMSRVDAVIIAVRKAGERINGAVLASDAYFPFPDGVETAGQAGVSAIIQPGGSINDKKVIAAANNAGLVMAFTGIRHFKH